jgi:hypothetical protein
MADIAITTYTNRTYKNGASTVVPGFVEGDPGSPVNPPGSGGASEFVPYVGANQNVNLGEFGLSTGYVTFDTTPTGTPTTQGTTYWDDARQTVALVMNGTIQHIGQDTFYYVKNSSGSPIPKGTCVRFAGTDGGSGHLLIEPFLANGTYSSNVFMGVTAETIANGSFGQVMHFGELDGINTSTYTAGALLYASTTVAGGFQTTVPVAPNNIVLVAAAINSKNNGTISVRPTYGSNINNDEGVKITSPTTGDLLQLQAGGLWENKSLATIGILTGSLTSGYIPRATGATTLTNSAIFETGTNVLIGSTTSSGEKFQLTGTAIFKTNLVSLDGADPVLRIRTNNNVSTVNFRNASNEDNAGIEGNFNTNSFNIITRGNNMNIRIEPNGTGKIVLPNLPTDTVTSFVGVNASNHLVKSSSTLAIQTTSTFTPTLIDIGGGYTYTLSSPKGFYIKTGKLVFINIEISVTSTSGASPSGGLRIGNLPFTSETSSGNTSGLIIHYLTGTNWSATILNRLTCRNPTNSTNVVFEELGTGVVPLAPSITSGSIFVTGCYYSNT